MERLSVSAREIVPRRGAPAQKMETLAASSATVMTTNVRTEVIFKSQTPQRYVPLDA